VLSGLFVVVLLLFVTARARSRCRGDELANILGLGQVVTSTLLLRQLVALGVRVLLLSVNGVLGVEVVSDGGNLLTSTLLLGQLVALGVRVLLLSLNGLLGVEVISNRGGLGVSTLLSLADLDSLGVFSNLLGL
jgi:hypothetical protein